MTIAAATDSVPFGLFLAVGAYVAACRFRRFLGPLAFLPPVLVAAVAVAVGLHLSGVPLAHFRRGADTIHALLGPATVALAVPLYQEVSRIRQSLLPVLASVAVGAVAAAAGAAWIAHLLGASPATVLSVAPKSVTTPIAMSLSESIGGVPGTTILCVAGTGILGAVAGSGFFRILGVRDPRAVGLGLGVAAHGIGTSRAFQLGGTEGAFSGLAMGLTGFLTAVLLPIFVRLLG